MPVYPFRCPKCNAKYELVTSVRDYLQLRNRIHCPDCGTKMKRIFTSFAIHGLEWNYLSSGYHPERDDPVSEIKYDMKKLEEKAMETTNLKKHRELKRALHYFNIAHRNILR